MKKNLMSNLSTNLCKKTLSLAMDSLGSDIEGCTFLLYEEKQPENLKKTDLKKLSRAVKEA